MPRRIGFFSLPLLGGAETIRVEMGGGGLGDILGAMMGGGMPMQMQGGPQPLPFPAGVSDKVDASFNWLVNTEWKGKSGTVVFNRDGELGGTLKACTNPRNGGQPLEGVCKWAANKGVVIINTPDTQRTSDKVLKFSVKGTKAYETGADKAEKKQAKALLDSHDETALKSVVLESTKVAARTGKASILEFVKIAGSSEEDSLLAEDAFGVLELLEDKEGNKRDPAEITAAEIKKAYRKLSVKYHPDKTGGDSSRFDKIRQAYEMLSDDDARKYYLEGGALLVKNVETHLKELESMHAQQMAQLDQQIPKNHPMRAQAEAQIGAQQKSKPQMKAEIEQRLKQEEQVVEVGLTLSELFRGVESKQFDYERLVICRGCRADSTLKDEKECAGCGRCPPEVREVPKMQGPFMVGSKTVEVESREKCKKISQTITGLRVPANAEDGTRLSVRGQMRGKILGHQTPGRFPGQVKLVVKREKDAQFRALGDDLYTVLSVSLEEAIYGFKREFNVFDDPQGPVRIERLGRVSKDGEVIKVERRGMFNSYGARGDLYVRIAVQWPETVPATIAAPSSSDMPEAELSAESELEKKDDGKLMRVWDRDGTQEKKAAAKKNKKAKKGSKAGKEEL